jgi:hypothetical protein
MARWIVSMTTMIIEADTAEEAIARAGEISGSHWEARNFDADDDEASVTQAVLRLAPDAVSWSAGVEEWDDGYWYSPDTVTAMFADGSTELLDFRDEARLAAVQMDGDELWQIVRESLTELSDRDGPLGRHSEVTVEITKETP